MSKSAGPKKKSRKTLPNSSELKGALCVQWRRSGNAIRPYYYRFWRENGRLRKQYVRLADAEKVRAECQANRQMKRAWRAEIAAARRYWRSLLNTLKREALGL